MNPDGSMNWPNLPPQVTGSDEIGTWAIVLLAALVALAVLRLLVKAWRWDMPQRRLAWGATLLVLPAAIYAGVHVLGVLFDAASHAEFNLWLERAGDSAVIVVLAILVVEGIDLFVWKGLFRNRFGESTPGVLVGVPAFLIYLSAAYLIAAAVFDIPITGAVISSGILLGVIGLSLQGTISDIFSGLFISLEQPFRIGDWIVTEDGRLGKVLEIDWRATRLLSFNNTVFVVPNSKIANSIIENRDELNQPYGHYFYVQMSPEAPAGLVRRVLLEAALSSSYVLTDPPPNVYLARANQRPYEYLVYVYFEHYALSWRGNGDVMTRIHEYLRRAGLEVAADSREVRHSRLPELPADEPPIQQLLGEIPLFYPLTQEEIEHLSGSVRTTRYRPGETVIQEGDAGDSLLVITTGLVRVTRSHARGGQVDVSRLGMGQCIGEMSLLTGRPRSATVEAVTDCEVVEIPKDSLTDLFVDRPELVDELARIMSERRAADELVSEADANAVPRLTLQELAEGLGRRIRSFFHL